MSGSAVSARLRSTKVMRLRLTGVTIMERKKGNILQGLRGVIRLPNGDFHDVMRSGKFAGTRWAGGRGALWRCWLFRSFR
jgi:hypothetical protein